MQSIESNLRALNDRITRACEAVDRDPAEVTLIGVSKTKPAAAVRTAANLGVCQLGENYLDEAIVKIEATRDLDLVWHYIGRIQSNKTRTIAELFDWVHTLDRSKIAQRLNDQCPADKKLNVLIQINIDADPAKGGVSMVEASTLLTQICHLPNLRARGLMTILAQDSNPRVSYQSMAQLFTTLGAQLDAQQTLGWDTLSMGMTGDLEAAIAAGATHVRIGRALFGERTVSGSGHTSNH